MILGKHRVVMAAEAAAGHESRFADQGGDYAPHIKGLVEEGRSVPLTSYVRDHLDWQRRRDEPVLPDDPQEIIVTPATIDGAPDLSTTGNPCMNAAWSYLGWPAISVPFGFSADGLPLAVQLVAPPRYGRQDAELLDAAAWCENVFRRAPGAGGI